MQIARLPDALSYSIQTLIFFNRVIETKFIITLFCSILLRQ